MKSKKGFTLIEILIVVAIIGILASVVLVGLGPVQKKGRDARRISDLRQDQNGLELYFTKNGTYPIVGTFADLQAALIGGSLGIGSVPNDPVPGKTYYYATDGGSYVLGATLEDTGNNVLNDDIDADPIAGGFSCADPVYCIQL